MFQVRVPYMPTNMPKRPSSTPVVRTSLRRSRCPTSVAWLSNDGTRASPPQLGHRRGPRLPLALDALALEQSASPRGAYAECRVSSVAATRLAPTPATAREPKAGAAACRWRVTGAQPLTGEVDLLWIRTRCLARHRVHESCASAAVSLALLAPAPCYSASHSGGRPGSSAAGPSGALFGLLAHRVGNHDPDGETQRQHDRSYQRQPELGAPDGGIHGGDALGDAHGACGRAGCG